MASHQRFYGLIHHFYSSRQPHAYGARRTARCAASGFERGGIRAMNGNRSCIGEDHAFAVFFIFSDIRFRMSGDAMGSRCARAAYGAGGHSAGCADGGQGLRRVRFHGGARSMGQAGAVLNACIGVAVIGLNVHAGADAAPTGEGEPAGEAEEFRAALGGDGRRTVHGFPFAIRAIGNIKISFSYIRVSGLGDLVHRHRAGAGELRCAACRADGHRLCGAIAFTVFGIAIVGVFCVHGEPRGFQRVFLFFVPFHVGSRGAFVNHDADGCAHRTAPRAESAYAGGGGAMIERRHSERAHVDAISAFGLGLRIGNMRRCGGGNFAPHRREGTCRFISYRTGGSNCRDFRLAFRRDRKAPLLRGRLFAFGIGHAADGIVFGVSLRVAGHQIHSDGCANGGACATAGEGHGAGVRVQRPFVHGFDGHRLRCADGAVLRISRGGVIDFIDRDLSRAGDAFAGAAAAGRHIEYPLFVMG